MKQGGDDCSPMTFLLCETNGTDGLSAGRTCVDIPVWKDRVPDQIVASFWRAGLIR